MAPSAGFFSSWMSSEEQERGGHGRAVRRRSWEWLYLCPFQHVGFVNRPGSPLPCLVSAPIARPWSHRLFCQRHLFMCRLEKPMTAGREASSRGRVSRGQARAVLSPLLIHWSAGSSVVQSKVNVISQVSTNRQMLNCIQSSCQLPSFAFFWEWTSELCSTIRT